MTTNQDHLDKLVKDLFRLGDYSSWISPKMSENIEWFTKNKKTFNSTAVAQRLEELINLGANVVDKAYLIANVNAPEALKVALENGANPNLKGKTGILPIDRALYKGKTKIAELLINSNRFDFKTEEGNVLFLAINTGKYKLANDIILKKPELIADNNKDGKSVLYTLSEYLSRGNKINSKVLTLTCSILNQAEIQNIDFTIAEIHNGKTLANNSPEIATLVTERFAIKLDKNLPKKENDNITIKKQIKL